MKERRRRPRAGPLLRFYYRTKYRLFKREKRPHDGRRGLIMLQVDALAYSDLRRASGAGILSDDRAAAARRRVRPAPLVLRSAVGDAILPGGNLSR